METVLQPVTSIEDARLRVADLLRKTTGPMHVPQPDGSTLRLCYVGRIMRAMEKMSAAPEDAQEVMRPRYRQIVDEAQAAWAAYVAARDDYIRQCEWAGVAPSLPEERECDCEVCRAHVEAEILHVAIA